MTKKTYKDFPGELRKRVKQLEASRDRWKEDHRKDQIEKKRLREKVKDEIERRDRWKTDYQASKRKAYLLEEKVYFLHADLESEKEEKEDLRKKMEEIKKKLKRLN